jgi:segregation and condensation protein B
MKTLLERDWVKVVGHRDVPGKPAMYATTRQFLDYFNLKSLSGLPTLAEIRDIDTINAELDLVDPDIETNVDTNAETSDEKEASSELGESVDFAANDAHKEMLATEDNELDADLDAELEDLPPLDEKTELKAASVADTA